MRRNSAGAIGLKYLKVSGRFPSGNPRLYFRRKGEKDIPLPDAPRNSPEFLAAYVKAAKGETTLKKQPDHRTGTIGAAIRAYMASDHFLTGSASTRQVRRRFLEEFEKVFAKARLADLRAKHIRVYLARYDPHPANNRLKAWRALCRWAVDAGLCDEDAARSVRPRPTPKTDGFIPWTDKDVEAFRKHWPIGSMQRLALELMAHTGAAIGDVIRLGPGNIKDGWLIYRRGKSGTLATCPITADWPEWFPGSPYLLECLGKAPKALTFLCTQSGKPRSAKAATQWFAQAARDAKIKGKSAHGVRKYLGVYPLEASDSLYVRAGVWLEQFVNGR